MKALRARKTSLKTNLELFRQNKNETFTAFRAHSHQAYRNGVESENIKEYRTHIKENFRFLFRFRSIWMDLSTHLWLTTKLLPHNGFFNIVLSQVPEDVPGSGTGGSGWEEAAGCAPPTARAGRLERTQAPRHGALHERSPETNPWCMYARQLCIYMELCI